VSLWWSKSALYIYVNYVQNLHCTYRNTGWMRMAFFSVSSTVNRTLVPPQLFGSFASVWQWSHSIFDWWLDQWKRVGTSSVPRFSIFHALVENRPQTARPVNRMHKTRHNWSLVPFWDKCVKLKIGFFNYRLGVGLYFVNQLLFDSVLTSRRISSM